MTLDDIDPTFIQDLRDSRVAVEVVTRWLVQRGYAVVVRPTFERPNPSQRFDYSDSGDLEIVQTVEVKRRGFTFTCKEDFPYPSTFVDTCHHYDKAHPKPYAYVHLNREMTAALIIEGRTRSHWSRSVVNVGSQGRVKELYVVALDYTQIVPISEGGSDV